MNDRFLEDLKSRIDLVEIVRKYSEVKKSGKNFMCRSPFRDERTPSFSISAEKQVWYDFGAAEGGDAIAFVEKVENCSFPEAVEILANVAGVQIPKNFGESKSSAGEKNGIFSLHRVATEFFSRELLKSDLAKKYLADRGVSKKIIEKWQIGFGGVSRDGCTRFLMESGFLEKSIAESGVAFEREFGDKKMVDRFRGRVILPVFEPRDGEIVAFSARVIPGVDSGKSTAKYMNSPENPVYRKSATLFGLNFARREIADRDAVILVEGNFDVISAHESGFPNTVATCGTALTDAHLRTLSRLTKNIFCGFDSDLAGKKATLRAIELILKSKLNPFVIEIADGKDFDDLARKSPKLLQKSIKNASPALDFLFEKFFLKFCGKNLDLDGEKKFLDEFFPFLRLANRPIEIDDFLEKIAKKFSRDKSVIEREFRNFNSRTRTKKPKFSTTTSQKFTREESFVGFLSGFWEFFEKKIDEEIFEIFCESAPKNVIEKKVSGKKLSDEEEKKLIGWTLHATNPYRSEPDEEILERDFQNFLVRIRREKIAKNRLIEAKNLQI